MVLAFIGQCIGFILMLIGVLNNTYKAQSFYNWGNFILFISIVIFEIATIVKTHNEEKEKSTDGKISNLIGRINELEDKIDELTKNK